MNSGVWPLSYVLNVLRFRWLTGTYCKALPWKWSVFRENSVRFAPWFKQKVKKM